MDLDVLCMQEVDCGTVDPAAKDSWHSALSAAGYRVLFTSKPEAPIHGLAIAYKTDVFEPIAVKTVFYESLATVSRSHSEASSLGSENVALLAALRVKGPHRLRTLSPSQPPSQLQSQSESEGSPVAPVVLLSNTHLNWRHMANWLKTRQIHALLSSMAAFAHALPRAVSRSVWASAAPAGDGTASASIGADCAGDAVPLLPFHFTCGDFNVTPTTLGYSLLKHRLLLPPLPLAAGAASAKDSYAVAQYFERRDWLLARGRKAEADALPRPVARGDTNGCDAGSFAQCAETAPQWLARPLAALTAITANASASTQCDAETVEAFKRSLASPDGPYVTQLVALSHPSQSQSDSTKSVTVQFPVSPASALASPLASLAYITATAAASASGASDLCSEAVAMLQQEYLMGLKTWAEGSHVANDEDGDDDDDDEDDKAAAAAAAAAVAEADVAYVRAAADCSLGVSTPLDGLVRVLDAMIPPALPAFAAVEAAAQAKAQAARAAAAAMAERAAAKAAKAAAKAVEAAAAAGASDATAAESPADAAADGSATENEALADDAATATETAPQDGPAMWARIATPLSLATCPRPAPAIIMSLPAPATAAATVSAALALLATALHCYSALAPAPAAVAAAAAHAEARLAAALGGQPAAAAALAATGAALSAAATLPRPAGLARGAECFGPAALPVTAEAARAVLLLHALCAPDALAGLLALLRLGPAAGPLLLNYLPTVTAGYSNAASAPLAAATASAAVPLVASEPVAAFESAFNGVDPAAAVPVSPFSTVLALAGQWAHQEASAAAVLWTASLNATAADGSGNGCEALARAMAAAAAVRCSDVRDPAAVAAAAAALAAAREAVFAACGAVLENDARVRRLVTAYAAPVTQRLCDAALLGLAFASSATDSAAAGSAAAVPVALPRYRSAFESYPALPVATPMQPQQNPRADAEAAARAANAAAAAAVAAARTDLAVLDCNESTCNATDAVRSAASAISRVLTRMEAVDASHAHTGYAREQQQQRPQEQQQQVSARVAGYGPLPPRPEAAALSPASGEWARAHSPWAARFDKPQLTASGPWSGTLDYIFYSAAPVVHPLWRAAASASDAAAAWVRVESLKPLPSVEEVAEEIGLPNLKRGSDHLLVAAQITLCSAIVTD